MRTGALRLRAALGMPSGPPSALPSGPKRGTAAVAP